MQLLPPFISLVGGAVVTAAGILPVRLTVSAVDALVGP